jgi:L-lactate dehydrogenase (cytochrome)
LLDLMTAEMRTTLALAGVAAARDVDHRVLDVR